MKIRTEILYKHPWWHKLCEHVHSKTSNGNAKDPDTQMPAVTETKVYACSIPNCKFHKTEIKIWSDY